MTPEPVTIGVIGAGLMGKELAAAIGRWHALEGHPVLPRLTHACDTNPAALAWFEQVASVEVVTTDVRVLLDDPDLDVLYIAVPHQLHQQLYLDAIEAGKDFLGEKPFGIDLAAATAIDAALSARPDLFVRCSSEMPFYPGAQAAYARVAAGRLGRIIEAGCGLLHSSDLDLDKPINWKRRAETNGAIGVMGDLGMHSLHVPLRLGWEPTSVYGVLQDLVADRPATKGSADRVRCDTFENATLLCRVDDGQAGHFPLTLEQKRIKPGEKNTWYFTALGLDGGVRYSTRHPKTLEVMEIDDTGEQVWKLVETGSQSTFPTITGGIFEFGFSDAILQMWASYLAERAGELGGRFGCASPAEALQTHRVFEAAMRSHADGVAVAPASIG